MLQIHEHARMRSHRVVGIPRRRRVSQEPLEVGAEALRVFLPGRFDLVLTNVGMAGMNGWELAERIRARDAEVPLVFITGWGLHEEDQARCRGLRISSLLFKPVRPDQLHATVQAVLGDPQRREDPAAPPRAPS